MKYGHQIEAAGLFLAAALALGGCAATTDRYPAVSDEGLPRVESDNYDAVYWREGASLAPYERVNIGAVSVEFRPHWQADQNASRVGLSDRVRDEDMQRIREALAKSFDKVFTRELQEGGYEVTRDTGADVLSLRPAIVNLDVNAPDLTMRQPGMVTTYTTSAGEMTLNLELYDSLSNSLIAQVIDHRRDVDTGFIQYTNSITNRADAENMMRTWARVLREALDEAHGRG